MQFLKSLFSKGNLLALVVIIVLIIQLGKLADLNSAIDYLEERDSSLITEIGHLKEVYSSFGDDLNEVRKFLLLPVKSYELQDDLEQSGDADSDSSETNANQLELALFKYIDYLGNETKNADAFIFQKFYFDDLKNSDTFLAFLNDENLKITSYESGENAVSMKLGSADEDIHVLSLYFSKENPEIEFKTVLEKDSFTDVDEAKFVQELKSYLSLNKNEIIKITKDLVHLFEEIESSIASKSAQDVLGRKNMSFGEKYEKGTQVYYPIKNYAGEILGEIKVETGTQNLYLIDNRFSEDELKLQVSDINSSLIPFLEDLDSSTLIEIKVSEAKKSLEATFADKGFLLLLDKTGLTVNTEPFEDEKRFWYKVYDKNENHIGSIVIEKATGVINIVDKDGTNSENLLFFDPSEAQKKNLELPDVIPEYGDGSFSADGDGTFNVLIAGKHGNLVDTMIFAHVNEKTRQIRMISIPRDLFYNGRKINAFPHFYGMPELKRVLSELSGYELNKYILIDMYAFIDVIDLIGGVDVHLEKPVIDPTYRTVDNGVVGTLHYEPGDYHLGGKEALRLARSRYTSSDFARAERQQLILEAIQNKARSFGFGDADTFYEIAKTVLGKTETDIKLDEAIAYYFRYQNFEIVSNSVMSSGNVLYVPPYVTVEQCNARIAQAQADGTPIPNCMNENHAYTLIPRDSNWNIVKWFFKENFDPAHTV